MSCNFNCPLSLNCTKFEIITLLDTYMYIVDCQGMSCNVNCSLCINCTKFEIINNTAGYIYVYCGLSRNELQL